jgi:membrane associated rhomboid family serine protease
VFVHVESRHGRGPRWATLLLVVLCVSAFVALVLSQPARQVQLLLNWGTVPARLFSAGEPFWQRVLDPDLIRLLTSLFLHVAWIHLLANMLFLVIFGLSAERSLGSGRFLALFLLGGIFANLIGALTLVTTSRPIIGCSGAVSAVVGAYLVLFPRARLGLVVPLGLYLEIVRVPAALLIGLWVLLQLLFTYAGPEYGAVVWWCHIAGFVFGAGFAVWSRKAITRRMRN